MQRHVCREQKRHLRCWVGLDLRVERRSKRWTARCASVVQLLLLLWRVHTSLRSKCRLHNKQTNKLVSASGCKSKHTRIPRGTYTRERIKEQRLRWDAHARAKVVDEVDLLLLLRLWLHGRWRRWWRLRVLRRTATVLSRLPMLLLLLLVGRWCVAKRASVAATVA